MIEITSVDRFSLNLATRGKITLFVVPPIPNMNPRTLYNQIVLLNGERVRVLGVETYGVIDPTNHAFAIEVNPEPMAAGAFVEKAGV